MSKRSATSELNRDNWDQEDEVEEAGTFKPVAQEELNKRAIKVARRRIPPKTSDQRPLFANFTGFGSKTSSAVPDPKSSFSFLSNLNGSNTQSFLSNQRISSSNENNSDNTNSSKENDYLNNIKSLNQCLMDWLDECIKKNPSCILTPIFQDYEKHLNSLSKPPVENSEVPKPTETASNFKFNFASNASSNQSQNSNSVTPTSQPSAPTLNPLMPSSTSVPSTVTSSWLSSSAISKSNAFSNLVANSTAKPTSLFSSSSNSQQSEKSENADGKDEDDGEPPSNDFKPVTEDDALFSQRVKLFIQKDKQYTDRGVGTFYIKEAKDANDKKIHQALIRADTNLGNIIFNIRLTSDIPTKRVGKNNVMLVCLPNPPDKSEKKATEKPQPVPVLLRVKTEDEADKLIEEINKYK